MDRSEVPRTRRGGRRSALVGAAFGAACLIAVELAAIRASGHVPAFAANRGLLQLLVVVPLTSFATAVGLTYPRILTFRQLGWAVLPVAALILLGTGQFGPGRATWSWTVVVSAALFLPWIFGGLLGSRLRRKPTR